MITGFNTDIEHEGTTYHVQTEDKGLETPLILSLVYLRGTILASKRSPYDDLLGNFDEKILSERLQKQHKLICAAIRAGRIEDLKRMTVRDSEKKRSGLVVQKEIAPPAPQIKPPVHKIPPIPPAPVFEELKLPPPPEMKKNPAIVKPPQITPPVAEKNPAIVKPPPIPLKPALDFAEIIAEEAKHFPEPPQKLTFEFPPETAAAEDEIIIEAVEIIEEEILPADAVAIISEATHGDATADRRMKIEVLGNPDFRSGEKKSLNVSVHHGTVERGIAGAQIVVKVLGAAFRPLIFHGKTDGNGIAVIHLQMPLFKAGRAAVLIKATGGGEEAEYRKTISLR